jgi:pilus assembly protein CpaB
MRLIVMFIAVALAAGAFIVTMHFSKESEKGLPVVRPTMTAQPVPTVDVYTAKRDIPIGAQISQEMLDIQPWPQHLMLPDLVPADPNQPNKLIKMVARTPFAKGEPIILNKLANEKDPSFLAATLPPGMRAVTIAVDAITGAAGFVFPGDRVDVLVTHDVKLPGHGLQDEGPRGIGPNGEPTRGMQMIVKGDPITEVLLANIRVLATNQKSTAHGGEPPLVPSSVTIEVSAADAQKLRLIENGNGRLSLALRSLKDKDEFSKVRPTGVGDLSRLTPPPYFPDLYDGDSHTTSDSHKEEVGVSSSIIVTRGVQAQEVEVSRP